jgi:hypothetical protein
MVALLCASACTRVLATAGRASAVQNLPPASYSIFLVTFFIKDGRI